MSEQEKMAKEFSCIKYCYRWGVCKRKECEDGKIIPIQFEPTDERFQYVKDVMDEYDLTLKEMTMLLTWYARYVFKNVQFNSNELIYKIKEIYKIFELRENVLPYTTEQDCNLN